MSYNSEHAASLDYVNTAIVTAYEKMQTWLTENVDQLDYVQRILEEEISALRVASGTYTSAYEAADAINTAVENIVSALETAGYDMTDIPLSSFADMITDVLENSGIYILDANEDEWTADEWTAYVEEHGEVPATANAIAIHTSSGVYYLALSETSSVSWGTYGVSVGNIDTYSGGFTGTPKSGLNNTLMLIAQFNPAVLIGSQYAIEDGASASYDDADTAKVLFFDSLDDLETWGSGIGAVALAALGTAKMYAVTLDADAGTYTNYYYSGAGGSVAFTSVRTVPYTDTKSVEGVPAAESCWTHNDSLTWNTSNTWVSYMPSVYEHGLAFLNADAITAALEVLGNTSWSTSAHWSSLQYNYNNAYCVEFSAGAVSSMAKNTAYVARAFLTKIG